MTNRYEDANYRQAIDDQLRARAHREAWDAVSFLVDLVAGRVPVPDDDDEDDPVGRAFLAIESFVDFASPDHELPSAAGLAMIDAAFLSDVTDTPS
jgi:hypothetical protein